MRTEDEIYVSLDQGIRLSLSSLWDQAWINITWLDDSIGVDGEYISPETDEVQFFSVQDQAFDDLEELYQIMMKRGDARWNRARYTLRPQGEFSFDMEWDQTLADQVDVAH